MPDSKHQTYNDLGFTLIEIMIVVAIIGVIAAFAYPNYQKSVKKAKRNECKSTLIELVSKIETEKSALRRYTAVSADSVGLSNTGTGFCGSLNADNATYTIALSPVADELISNQNWEIVATPVNQMVDTGTLKINQRAQKCWTEGQNCTLSATSSWDE